MNLEILKRRNSHNRRCFEDSKSYDDLATQLFIEKAGCKPYWNRFKFDEFQYCTNLSMLKVYNDEKVRFAWMHRDKIIETTKCLLPCSFMEYKVILETTKHTAKQIFNFVFSAF